MARIVPIACAASCMSSVGRTCVELGPLLDHARADVDDRLDDAALGTGDDDRAHAALDRVARLPLREHVLGRLVQHDAREERAFGEATAVAQDRDRARRPRRR